MHVECDIIDYGCSVAHTKPDYIFEFCSKINGQTIACLAFYSFWGLQKVNRKRGEEPK